jgi:hypothetical protein
MISVGDSETEIVRSGEIARISGLAARAAACAVVNERTVTSPSRSTTAYSISLAALTDAGATRATDKRVATATASFDRWRFITALAYDTSGLGGT